MRSRSIRMISLAWWATLLLSAANVIAAPDPREIVVAERDGVRVTLHDVDAQVMQLPKHLRAGYLDNPERIEQVVGGLLLNKQLAAQAERWGATADPYFEAQLQAAREDLLAKRARALNEDELIANKPNFSALAEEIFYTHPNRFRRPVSLNLEHVLVMERGRSKDEAWARAETARQQLLEGTRPFEEIFNEFSDEALDLRQISDGVLTNVLPGATEPPFEEAAFALTQKGQVSEIIRTNFGLHVVRLIERKEPTPQTLEDVKPSLVLEQENTYLQQGKTRFLNTIAEKPLHARQEVVAQLRTRYERAATGELAPAVDGSEQASSETVTAAEQ